MEIHEALTVLGVDWASSWEQTRAAYRDQLMQHHPDHVSVTDGSAGDTSATRKAEERTAEVVAAFRVLREATSDGLTPLPASLAPVPGTEQHPVVLVAPPGDIFTRLAAALEAVGEVSFVDRESEILGATINRAGQAAAHLSAEIDRSNVDPQIQFTLETLTAGPAPDLAIVVSEIAASLR